MSLIAIKICPLSYSLKSIDDGSRKTEDKSGALDSQVRYLKKGQKERKKRDLKETGVRDKALKQKSCASL